jgi:tRNA acetyltransferase TAN1
MFNLIATSGRGMEFDAKLELERLLLEIGDEEAEVWESGIGGLILGRTNLGPKEAVAGLRTLVDDRPFDFRLLRRVIPLEVHIETDLEKIERECTKLSERIQEEESFRVTVEKRHTDLGRRELIEAAAKNVDSPVDLEQPDWILLVEVVGDETGISLLGREEEILNVTDALRERGEAEEPSERN